MRIVERESKQGVYIIIIAGLITSYFSLYILTMILFFVLLWWLFFCSSKVINPTIPNAIVSPISGTITQIIQENDSIEFTLKPRMNGRICAPSDLQNIHIYKQHGFYLWNTHLSQLSAKDTLEADTMLENEKLKIKIVVIPKFFKICRLSFPKTDALFLEKIGFLNTGILKLSITGKHIITSLQEGSHVEGGISALINLDSQTKNAIS